MQRISQRLTGRIKELAEKYATPMPALTSEVTTAASLLKFNDDAALLWFVKNHEWGKEMLLYISVQRIWVNY
ncbi:hypothetical protein KKE26_04105 [bacterium]|nr:hypothetical protein [bacterium]